LVSKRKLEVEQFKKVSSWEDWRVGWQTPSFIRNVRPLSILQFHIINSSLKTLLYTTHLCIFCVCVEFQFWK
jgi:hypothetical protein